MNINVETCALNFSYHDCCLCIYIRLMCHWAFVLFVLFTEQKISSDVYAFCMFHLYNVFTFVDPLWIVPIRNVLCCVSVAIRLFTTTVVDVLGTIMLAVQTWKINYFALYVKPCTSFFTEYNIYKPIHTCIIATRGYTKYTCSYINV